MGKQTGSDESCPPCKIAGNLHIVSIKSTKYIIYYISIAFDSVLNFNDI